VLVSRLLAVLALALAFRLPLLDLRPMHADEAIEAHRAVLVLETRRSAYDPAAFHGPVLSLLTAPVLGVAGVKSLAGCDEWMFRIVPAVAGALVALTPFLFADGIGVGAAAAAGVALAVSPAFVYWSRDAIPEILLVLFFVIALACARRGAGRRACAWDWGAGLFAGVAIATKETAWLMLGAAGAAVAGHRAIRREVAKGAMRCVGPAVVTLGAAALLLGGPGALTAPFRAWAGLGLSGGEHAHPWWYFGLLVWSRPLAGEPVWSEAAILVLAGLGAWRGRARPLVGFLTTWTLAVLFAYSVISYKTPWCLLGFWWGGCMLAGVGAAEEWRALGRRGRRRTVWVAVLAVAAIHLGWQAWRAAFVWPADRRNPYAYAQSVEDVVRLGDQIERLARVHADRERMLVAVVAPDPWPLPWYLRRLSRVGYWTVADADARRAIRLAPVVVATPGLVRPPGDRVVQHYGTRAGVILELSVERKLWERAVR